MGGAQPTPSSFNPRQARKPSQWRQAQLDGITKEKESKYRDPFHDVEIRTIGELLWILQRRNWTGGLTEEGVRAYGKHARWFTELRTAEPVTEGREANLRFADLHGVALQYVNLSKTYLLGANLQGADLTRANLVKSDVRAANLDGANLTGAALVDDEQALRAMIAANTAQGGPTYSGIWIGPRTDLLWVLRHAGWFTGITASTPPSVDWRGVNFRETSVCDADVRALNPREQAIIHDGLIGPNQRAALENAYDANSSTGREPYSQVEIRSWPELLWILLERGWTGTQSTASGSVAANFREANLSMGTFNGIILVGADFASANIERATLYTPVLSDANLVDANLVYATLLGADLRRARLQRSHLDFATLTRAKLQEAQATGVNLRCTTCSDANFSGCDLNGAKVNADTLLDGIVIDSHTRFGSTNWDTGVSLIAIDWSRAPQLGEEDAVHKAEVAYQQNPSNGAREKTYLDEVQGGIRAYLALSVALRRQGISVAAGNYHVRSEVLHRRILHAEKRRWSLLGSWMLDTVVGYGERPSHTLAWYVGVILLFTAIYYVISNMTGPHFSLPELLVFSVTSFHGRGFFPNPTSDGIALGNPMTWFAAAEAMIGVVIEATFVAAFAHRFVTSG